MTRTIRTPADRAAEAVAVLERRVAKLKAAKAKLQADAAALDPEIAAVQKRLDYALSNPDLPPRVAPGSGSDRG